MNIKEFAKKNRNISGIYCWYSKTSKKSYIGSSIKTGRRISVEYNELLNHKFINPAMQKDWDLFGESDFCVTVLRRSSKEKLLELETKFISNTKELYNKNTPITIIDLSIEQQKMFWSHIDIKNNEDCWDWQGFVNKGGYGSGLFRKDGCRMPYLAHRIAFFLSYPEVNIHNIICHKCDNRKCCNPNHLFAGSSSDNSKDMINKNRGSKQILNKEDVDFIRGIYILNVFIKRDELVRIFIEKTGKSISGTNLVMVCQNKSWYDENYNPPPRHVKDIEVEIKENFYNKPEISCEEIRKYVFDKYGMKIGKEGLKRVLDGRQSKFIKDKKDDPKLIAQVLELKSQNFTHNDIVSYLSSIGTIISYNTIWRILKSQKETI